MRPERSDEDRLTAEFAALAAAGAPDAPASIERRVMAAFDARRNARARGFGWWMPAGAAAAIAVMAATVGIHKPASPPRAAEAPFMEIPYVTPLAPYERIEVKRMDVPVAALIAAGFEVHAPDTGASLRADVLFGQDGRAHAIRIVTKD